YESTTRAVLEWLFLVATRRSCRKVLGDPLRVPKSSEETATQTLLEAPLQHQALVRRPALIGLQAALHVEVAGVALHAGPGLGPHSPAAAAQREGPVRLAAGRERLARPQFPGLARDHAGLELVREDQCRAKVVEDLHARLAAPDVLHQVAMVGRLAQHL